VSDSASNHANASNADLFERAKLVMPGGVNSPVRSFRSVGGTPYFVDKAEGPYVWDVEGQRYIDYVLSYGPCILGHANPTIVDAVSVAAGNGTSYGAPTEREVLMAEEMCSRVQGLEMLRLVSSGTEAAMSAIRSPGAQPAGTSWSSSQATTTATATTCWQPAEAASPTRA